MSSETIATQGINAPAPRPPNQAGPARSAEPRRPVPTGALVVSDRAAAGPPGEGERLAAAAAAARAASGALLPGSSPAEPAKPSIRQRIARGAALVLSPLWAPIGLIGRFGSNLARDAWHKEFHPISTFNGARRDVRRDLVTNWHIAVQGRYPQALPPGSGPAGPTG